MKILLYLFNRTEYYYRKGFKYGVMDITANSILRGLPTISPLDARYTEAWETGYEFALLAERMGISKSFISLWNKFDYTTAKVALSVMHTILDGDFRTPDTSTVLKQDLADAYNKYSTYVQQIKTAYYTKKENE